jgi:phosphoglycerate dehydrogenase-like enzyme
MDREALRRMKAGAYLINTSRGPLIDEEALCDALDAGQIRGAALDVYEHEPVVNPRLVAMPNVVIVPHIGSATEEARNAMAKSAATDVYRLLKGQPVLHGV